MTFVQILKIDTQTSTHQHHRQLTQLLGLRLISSTFTILNLFVADISNNMQNTPIITNLNQNKLNQSIYSNPML